MKEGIRAWKARVVPVGKRLAKLAAVERLLLVVVGVVVAMV